MLYNKFHPIFLGAIGEKKAVDELKKLPDNYFIINNVFFELMQPIFNRKENDMIYSVQIDHVIVGPTGVFLIETKNWSEISIQNRDLFSPVTQIKRHNYAFYKLLNQAINNSNIITEFHHWGNRKISIRNIILMIGSKPEAEFEFVKIKMLKEIRNYIEYFPKILSEVEADNISKWLIKKIEHDKYLKEESRPKTAIEQASTENKIFFRNDRCYIGLSDGRIREITVTLIAGIISLVIGIIWAIAGSTVLPLFLVPLLGLGLGYLIDLAIEEERKKN